MRCLGTARSPSHLKNSVLDSGSGSTSLTRGCRSRHQRISRAISLRAGAITAFTIEGKPLRHSPRGSALPQRVRIRCSRRSVRLREGDLVSRSSSDVRITPRLSLHIKDSPCGVAGMPHTVADNVVRSVAICLVNSPITIGPLRTSLCRGDPQSNRTQGFVVHSSQVSRRLPSCQTIASSVNIFGRF